MAEPYDELFLNQNGLTVAGLNGLRNLGNTCYMNAIVQALSNCPQLTEFILECQNFLDPQCKRVLFSHYFELLSEIWDNDKACCFNPAGLLDAFCTIHPIFRGFSQHDAQEFLRLFLVQMHEELKYSTSLLNPNELKSIPNSTESRSIITDVFQGRLISTVRCLTCNRLSNREELFMDLSLSLAKPPSVKLNKISSSSTLKKKIPLLETHSTSVLSSPSPPPVIMNGSVTTGLLTSLSISSNNETVKFQNSNSSIDNLTSANSSRPSSVLISVRKTKFAALSNLCSIPVLGPTLMRIPWLLSLIISFLHLALLFLQKYIVMSYGWIDRWSTLTVDECLAHYFSEAELVGENKYFCARCNKRCNGLKQFRLLAIPEVLTLHLKRFSSSHTYSSKVTTPLSFPIKGLDLRPFLHRDCTDEVTVYDLIGVVCHHGGYGGGHYTTCAFNVANEQWYEFDDDQVRQIDLEQVENLKNSAYILFYRKQDDHLRPLRQYWKSIPSAPVCYISKSWFIRFWTWAEPGPLTSEFLCEHNGFRPDLWALRNFLTIPIPESIWHKLILRFNSHKIVKELTPCAICTQRIAEKQSHELAEFKRLKSIPLMKPFTYFAISKKWLDAWLRFAVGAVWVNPGPIDNKDVLLCQSGSSSTYLLNRSMEVASNDYEVISAPLWNLFHSIYGGGPIIPIHTVSPKLHARTISIGQHDELLNSSSASASELSVVHFSKTDFTNCNDLHETHSLLGQDKDLLQDSGILLNGVVGIDHHHSADLDVEYASHKTLRPFEVSGQGDAQSMPDLISINGVFKLTNGKGDGSNGISHEFPSKMAVLHSPSLSDTESSGIFSNTTGRGDGANNLPYFISSVCTDDNCIHKTGRATSHRKRDLSGRKRLNPTV